MAGAPTGDLLTDGLVEDEKIIDREKEEQKSSASRVPREQGEDRVDQDGQEDGEMKKGEEGVGHRGARPGPAEPGPGTRSYLASTRVAEMIVIGSRGTSRCMPLEPVGTAAIASTISMPATTLPNTA